MNMEMQTNDTPRAQNPRRRKRSKLQIFKEAYLPTIILAVTVVLIIVFIIGAAVSGPDPKDTQPSDSGTSSTPPSGPEDMGPSAELVQEAADRLTQAAALAAQYDYEGAIRTIDGFSGNIDEFTDLAAARAEYADVLANMVSWNSADVANLSFNILIADPNRAFSDSAYGSSYKKNFVTVSEFSAILQQLYEGGYVLVDLDDFYALEYNSSSGRYVYTEKQLLLPAGKTPIMLTETHANYYTYMTDSNGDGKPDAGADGFAARLCHDENGFYNELVNADGSVSTGSYDVVPLLEDFIGENPDFSYRGARAIIAFTGYDGVLGYRINSTKLSAADLQAEREGAAAVIDALKNAGYKLACYTYDNYEYADMTATKIQADIQKWEEKITPWIGDVDILVFARNGGDIAGAESYSGNSKFNVLYNAGFRYFLAAADESWSQVSDLYVRHTRLNVTGTGLLNGADKYAEYFDAAAVLDNARG